MINDRGGGVCSDWGDRVGDADLVTPIDVDAARPRPRTGRREPPFGFLGRLLLMLLPRSDFAHRRVAVIATLAVGALTPFPFFH
jgi:hypothetical protein